MGAACGFPEESAGVGQLRCGAGHPGGVLGKAAPHRGAAFFCIPGRVLAPGKNLFTNSLVWFIMLRAGWARR